MIRQPRSQALWLILLLSLIQQLLTLTLFWPTHGWVSLHNGYELGSIARNIALGNGFSSPFGIGSSPSAWFAPLVPYAWAGLFWIFGIFSPLSLVVLYAAQIIARAIIAVLFFQLLEKHYGPYEPVSKRTPFLGAALIALWPMHVTTLALPWYIVWQELFVLLTLVIAYSDSLKLNSLQRSMLLGSTTGLTLLINPSPIFFSCWIVIAARKRISLPIVFALMVLFLTPWTVRNYLAFEKFVPFRSNFGVELRQGNSPGAMLIQSPQSRHPATNQQELARFLSSGETAYSAHALEESVDFIVRHPAETILRTIGRIILYWTIEVLDLQSPHFQGAASAARMTAAEIYLYAKAVLNFALLARVVGIILRRAKSFDNLPPWLLPALILLPLPYYFTHISPAYAWPTKAFLLLFALLAQPRRV